MRQSYNKLSYENNKLEKHRSKDSIVKSGIGNEDAKVHSHYNNRNVSRN